MRSKHKILLLIMALAITVLEADCANISYEEARNLTDAINLINKPTELNPRPLVAGIQVLPGLLEGLVEVDVTPRSYTVGDIWVAYCLGIVSFDRARHDYPEIYRGYVNVKIRGKSYIIEVASPDLEGIPYSLTNESILNKSIPAYYEVANELINKQLAQHYPMEEASNYRKADA
jgi:hypothetical protein